MVLYRAMPNQYVTRTGQNSESTLHGLEMKSETRRKVRKLVFQLGALVIINGVILYLLNIRQFNDLPNTYAPQKQFEKSLREVMNTTIIASANITSDVSDQESSTMVKEGNDNPECYRQVQFWMGSKEAATPTVQPCQGLPCGIKHVVDTSFETMQNSDAVVLFHLTWWDWDEMHRRRPPGQKWLFYTLESPRHAGDRVIPPERYYNNSYDYTLGYRRDATIQFSYGYYDPDDPEIKDAEPQDWAAQKSRLIAWMASNCGTSSWRRNEFVHALSQHIPVDMYGVCGNMQCPRGPQCTEILKQYKFYLALENSECDDYITEKFWHRSLGNGIVPVAYGPMKESYEHAAPPNSFIHLHDFTSLSELADFLRKLDGNNTLYNSYLSWKRHGSIKNNMEFWHLTPNDLCKVVAKLLEDEKVEKEGKPLPLLPDLNSWWKGSCRSRPGFPRDF